jgi:hypothetical protein
VVHATFVNFISVPLLGIHATLQGLIMQGIVLALVSAGVLVGGGGGKRTITAN